MCGIVASTSCVNVARVTVERLARLEYRGYDSYGLATLDGDQILVAKGIGSIGAAVATGFLETTRPARLALGHTRWATHGYTSEINAHPHLSFDGAVAIAHNGVIANHSELRAVLRANGIDCLSQTDSEVVAHMIALRLQDGRSALSAICLTMAKLTGEYALGIISRSEPDTIYGVRNRSPLVASYDGSSAVLASDKLALTGMPEGKIVYLEDRDVIRLRADRAEVYTVDALGRGRRVSRRRTLEKRVMPDPGKGGYAHFMLKEIHETAEAAEAALSVPGHVFKDVIPFTARPVTLFGAGSGYYVAQIGQYLLSQVARVTAMALPSDEAQEFATLQPGDCAIALSQSGETFDTLEMCRAARDQGAVVTSICNVPNSTQERLSQHRLQQRSGPEISVLSTKSLVSQVVLLARLALEAGTSTATLVAEERRHHDEALAALPEALRRCVAAVADPVKDLARALQRIENWFFIGRGIYYPAALEDALKFKEGTYLHAEGMSAGFFKHGTISLVSPGFHTVALVPSAPQQTAALATVSEIAARGGAVSGFGPHRTDARIQDVFTNYIELPYLGDEIADVVVQLVAGQLFAYYFALNLGREIDQPRYLAKSVTVR